MSSFFYGMFGGIIAWFVTTFIGQPLSRFVVLRSEAAKLLARYEDRYDVTNPEQGEPPEQWLEERRKAHEDGGVDLIAFADANVMVTKLLRNRFLPKEWKCYPKSAGDALRNLGKAAPGAQNADYFMKNVRSGLKLLEWHQQVSHSPKRQKSSDNWIPRRLRVWCLRQRKPHHR